MRMDWSDKSFWQWLGAALTLVVTVIGIGLAATLDINRYLEGRQESREKRLKALCPHAEKMFAESCGVWANSQFNSLTGTAARYCNWCGLMVTNTDLPLEISKHRLAINESAVLGAKMRVRKHIFSHHGVALTTQIRPLLRFYCRIHSSAKKSTVVVLENKWPANTHTIGNACNGNALATHETLSSRVPHSR